MVTLRGLSMGTNVVGEFQTLSMKFIRMPLPKVFSVLRDGSNGLQP